VIRLPGPGVAAAKKLPIRRRLVSRRGLPAYLDAGFGYKMRSRPSFKGGSDPDELVETIKPTLIIAPVLFLLAGIGSLPVLGKRP
jgi:hypothetical protein